MHLRFCGLGTLENWLVCKISDKEGLLCLFEGKGGRLTKDSKDDFCLAFAVELEDVSVLWDTVNNIVEYDGRREFVGILYYCSALLQSLHMYFTVHL